MFCFVFFRDDSHRTFHRVGPAFENLEFLFVQLDKDNNLLQVFVQPEIVKGIFFVFRGSL